MADINTTEGGRIKNGLPGKAMRYAMETKGLLENKGSIYVGMGTDDQTTINGDEGSGSNVYHTPHTAALNPPTAQGTYALVCNVSSSGQVTIGWKSVSNLSGSFVVSL